MASPANDGVNTPGNENTVPTTVPSDDFMRLSRDDDIRDLIFDRAHEAQRVNPSPASTDDDIDRPALNEKYGVPEKPQIHLHYTRDGRDINRDNSEGEEAVYLPGVRVYSNFNLDLSQVNQQFCVRILDVYIRKCLTIHHCPGWHSKAKCDKESNSVNKRKSNHVPNKAYERALSGNIPRRIGGRWVSHAPYYQVNLRWRPAEKITVDAIPGWCPLDTYAYGFRNLRAIYIEGSTMMNRAFDECAQYTPEAAFHHVQRTWRQEMKVDLERLWSRIPVNLCKKCGVNTWDGAPLKLFVRAIVKFPGKRRRVLIRATPTQFHKSCWDYEYEWWNGETDAQGNRDFDWEKASFGIAAGEYHYQGHDGEQHEDLDVYQDLYIN